MARAEIIGYIGLGVLVNRLRDLLRVSVSAISGGGGGFQQGRRTLEDLERNLGFRYVSELRVSRLMPSGLYGEGIQG